MTGLRDTLTHLKTLRRDLAQALGAETVEAPVSASTNVAALRQVADFGTNPGRLDMRLYVPEKLPKHPALLVALHGCSQTAATYDAGSGWSTLAERNGFIVLYPEQQRGNNPNRCFNWFVPANTHRDSGEALSIRQMIEQTVIAYGIGRSRIFVTGLSAGGAMTSTLLAIYPEIFAAGAIVAGLPHGSAASMSEAMQAMSQGRTRSVEQWGEIVRGASSHHGVWPRVAIWHGTDDHIVRAANAESSLLQWTNVHGLPKAPASDVTTGKHRLRLWKDGKGRNTIEVHTIAGMGHGVALAPGDQNSVGLAGPFHFDVGIASSMKILEFFGIAAPAAGRQRKTAVVADLEPVDPTEGVHGILRNAGVLNDTMTGRRRNPPLGAEVHRIINRALRSAGLLKKSDDR